MKWDWRVALGVALAGASSMAEVTRNVLGTWALMLEEDHDWRLEREEWANAVLEEINSIPVAEKPDA